MSVYNDDEQLYAAADKLFARLGQEEPKAVQSFLKTRLAVRMKTTDPEGEILVDARKNPLRLSYGATTTRPDLTIDLSGDALHQILLGDLGLAKALGSGQMKVDGPVFKAMALAELFHQGQRIYPQVLNDLNIRY